MNDKPLDCVGVTGDVGKHDYRENPEGLSPEALIVSDEQTKYSLSDTTDLVHEDNERMLAEAEAKAKIRKCDFCGLDEHHVDVLIAGLCAFICGNCTQLCADHVLRHLYDKALRLQKTIKEMEKQGGIPAVAGVSDMDIPKSTQLGGEE